jgi:ABC-2 type transport system ATP-binding protein
MSRDELRHSVGRYRVEMPAGWRATRELEAAGMCPTVGREGQWTLVGDQRELIDRLTLAGALVREVQPLALEDATLAYLAQEVTR